MKHSWQTQDITPDVEQDFTNFLGLGTIFQNIPERRESSGSGGTDNQVGNAEFDPMLSLTSKRASRGIGIRTSKTLFAVRGV